MSKAKVRVNLDEVFDDKFNRVTVELEEVNKVISSMEKSDCTKEEFFWDSVAGMTPEEVKKKRKEFF